MPLIAETLIRLNKATVFIKLDIRQAFYYLYIYLDLKELITFCIRYRLYKYKVIPFRLYNGPGSYQRYINNLFFEYFDQFYTVYINDIFIYLENRKDY